MCGKQLTNKRTKISAIIDIDNDDIVDVIMSTSFEIVSSFSMKL